MSKGNGNYSQLQRQGKMTQRQVEFQLKKRYGNRSGQIKTHKIFNPSKLGPEWN